MSHSSSRRARRTAALAGATALLAAVTGLSGPAAEAAAGPAGQAAASSAYLGYAFGSTVSVGGVATSGRSAPVVLGCGNRAGVSESNSSAGTAVPGVVRSGPVTTTATTSTGPVRSATTARTEGLSLLGGMVTADAVEAASSTSRSGGAFATTARGTTFVRLMVAGQGMPVTPTPNMRVDLPNGIGYVVLDEQTTTHDAHAASLAVNALHLVVTKQGVGGVAAGTDIVVSHASSGLTTPVVDVLGGHSYGTRLTAAGAVNSGPSFEEFQLCLGTGGRVRTNTGAGLTISTALRTGAIRNTARGTVSGSAATGETTSTVDSAAVMGNLVKATVITADAHASTSAAGARMFSDAGSTFGTLSVMGKPMSATQPANTTMAIPGVGTLYLHRVLRHGSVIEVRMIELVLTSPNGSLPAGADLTVGEALASLG